MFTAYIKGGNIAMGSKVKAVFINWLAENEGKVIVIDVMKKGVSDQQRGYLFGAVIPFLKRIVPPWESLDNDQVYEILKKEFNSFQAYNPRTDSVEKYGQSIMARGNKAEDATVFIEEIGRWIAENYGQKMPDPEKYKRWKDSVPLIGEDYVEE